jgi:zinc protease
MKNRAWLATLVVCPLLFGQTGFSQDGDMDIKIPYEKFVLKNGLTVLVHEDHKAPIVAVNVWYHVGSKNEKPGRTGFAHLFEHLMFGGSEHFKGRYINAMEEVGATDLNGTTNEDRTNYFENVPTQTLDFALWMESDRMGHLLGAIDQKTLDLQRGVVQNEKRQGENQPYGVTEQLIVDNTYPKGHPYSWTVIGSMEDLNAAALDDVKEWFRTYYGPSNVTLTLAGDIDVKTAREKVEKYFGDIPPGPPVAHQQVWIAKRTGSQLQRVQDRVPQGRVYMVWNIPQFGSADGDYLDLISDVLSIGKSSRLYKRLVYDDQIATAVNAGVDLREIGGQFQIVATAKAGGDLGVISKTIHEELDRFLKEGPTAEEVERVKTRYRANFVRGIERIGGFGGKSDRLAQGQVFLGNPDAYQISLQRVAHATAEDLKGAAQRWLSDGVYELDVTPYPEYAAATTGADRSKPPTPGAAAPLKVPAVQRAKLSNGLKIELTERHELPDVNFALVLDAGYAADQGITAGTAKLTTTMLANGTRKRTALEISDQLQLLGAQLTAGSNVDQTTVFLSAIKDKLRPSLDLYSDVILNPSFPESDFNREKKLQLASIERERVTPFQMGLRVLPALIYGKGHAYGNPLTGSGDTEGVTRLTREDLARFHETWFRPNNATLIVVGDTTLAEIVPELEKVFGSWQPGEVPKKNIADVTRPAKPVIYLMDRPGSQQSVIFAGIAGPHGNNPQEAAIDVMNDVLGGTFSSRLNMNLREDKHWSYGVFSLLQSTRGQQPFLFIGPVQTDKTKESLAEIHKEFLGIVGDKPISADELSKAKANATLKLPGTLETKAGWGGQLARQLQLGLPDDYLETFAAKVSSLTTADVEDAAQTLVRPDNLVWVIVGDKAKIEAGVRELNIGEIRHIDGDGKPVD